MNITFQTHYRTQWGESVWVILGDKQIELHTSDGDLWKGTADIALPKGGLPLLYRYGIMRDGVCVREETNCMPHFIENNKQKASLVLDAPWREAERVAGTAVPVFSLRSEGSFGIGDFGDLYHFVDWAVATHQRAIQILPIGDTTSTETWQDSYPYNAISIYAFHPQYIDVRQLPAIHNRQHAVAFETKRKQLNALPQIDYEAVNQTKRAYLKELFEQEGKKCLDSAGFREFYQHNEYWLRPYAAFSVLRDLYHTPDSKQWPVYSTYDKKEIEAFTAPSAKTYHEVAFYYYMQYLLHVQLLRVSNYARAHEVILKGDIPIGISTTSVDAWVEPFYFNMKGSAGAPPDAFSVNGQNWGFPTYNWEAMLQDGLQWWLRRFRKMEEYFSAYRIDHILGFFRIWEIPTHSVHGLLGQFAPSLPMSPAEIERYGLPFQKDFMTQPFINETLLEQKFGALRETANAKAFEGKDPVQYVKDTFLDHQHDDIWQMKSQFATQRQVEAFFKGKTQPADITLREGLYALISDVLFVEDHRTPGVYHPRISAQLDYVYSRLQGWERDAFNTLYNDYFYRRHNQFWYEQAMKKLPALVHATQMIVCGEDLGMVPDCVPWVMEQLKILSLEIQRMPKNPGDAFGHVARYPERSVCTTGTHDTETLRQWWSLDAALTERYYHEELGLVGDAPAEATPDICQRIVEAHLQSPSLLCILPLQDWLAISGDLRLPDANAERINIPANPRHYWRYRMHLSIEQLLKATAFNQQVAEMVTSSRRR